MRATIDSMNRNFFHAITEAGDRVYCHQSECLDFRIDGTCQVGDAIDVEWLQEEPRGYRGMGIAWIGRPAEGRTVGTIIIVNSERGFAFMRPKDSPDTSISKSPDDVLIHISSCVDYQQGDSVTFNRMSRGDRVSGVVRDTTRGRRASQVEMVE